MQAGQLAVFAVAAGIVVAAILAETVAGSQAQLAAELLLVVDFETLAMAVAGIVAAEILADFVAAEILADFVAGIQVGVVAEMMAFPVAGILAESVFGNLAVTVAVVQLGL